MPNYAIVVFYSEEDESWIADIPDLEYCSAFGDTPHEAVKEVEIALEGWLKTAKENNIPIPEPGFKPAHLRSQFEEVAGLVNELNEKMQTIRDAATNASLKEIQETLKRVTPGKLAS